MPDRVAQRVIGAVQVDVDGLSPLFGLDLVERRPDTIDARVREHDIEPTRGVDEALHRCRYLLGVGHVGLESRGLSSRSLYIRSDRFQRFLIAAKQPYVRTVMREQQRRGTTNTRARAGYQCRLT